MYVEPLFGTFLVVWLLCSVALGFGLSRNTPRQSFPRDLGAFVISTLAVGSFWGGALALLLMLPIAVLGSWLGFFS